MSATQFSICTTNSGLRTRLTDLFSEPAKNSQRAASLFYPDGCIHVKTGDKIDPEDWAENAVVQVSAEWSDPLDFIYSLLLDLSRQDRELLRIKTSNDYAETEFRFIGAELQANYDPIEMDSELDEDWDPIAFVEINDGQGVCIHCNQTFQAATHFNKEFRMHNGACGRRINLALAYTV